MRKILLLCFVLIICLFPLSGKSQFLGKFGEGIAESYRTKPKFIIGLDSRRSFISSRDVSIFGLRAGFELAPKVRMGFGFYGLGTRFVANFAVPSDSVPGQTDIIESRLRFGYFALFWEYVIFQNKRWEFSSPFYIGVGSSEFEGVDRTRNPIGVSELSIQGQYKIFSWFGIGGGAGYRVLFPSNSAIQETFNSPIYAIKIKFFFEPIYEAIFKKKDARDLIK